MSNIVLHIDIEESRWSKAIADITGLVEKTKTATFDYVMQHTNFALLHSEKPINVNICLSNDSRVHQLNRDFRGMDKATNVLSFANIDFADFSGENDLFPEIELGDIIIAYETMLRESEMENITLSAHFCHLLVHGFLHILGFDHITDDAAEYMEGFEIAILHNLSIPNPYERDDE